MAAKIEQLLNRARSELRSEITRRESELAALRRTHASLGMSGGKRSATGSSRGAGPRRLSPAGRRAIALAAKRRWAAFRKTKKKA